MSDVSTNATSQPPSKAGAVTSLAAMPEMESALLAGLLLVVGDDPAEFSHLQATNRAEPVMTEIAKWASDKYRKCEVIDYGPGSVTVGSQVMWKPLSDVPLLGSILEDSGDFANLKPFNPKTKSISNVRLIAIRMESDRVPTIFVQAIESRHIVASSTRHSMLVKRGSIDVADPNLLTLVRDVTAILFDNYIFFSKRSEFQRLFGLLEELQKQAATTFSHITEGLKIDGLDEMRVAVISDVHMLGKMASIQRMIDEYPKYKQAMTMARLLPFIRGHPKCGVDLSSDGDDAHLVFRNDSQHRFKILRLLDDDHLKSELTDFVYEANSKSSLI
jgi:hypothetical protein